MQTEFIDDKMIVYLSGEIDHHNAKTIREQIDRNIKESFCCSLILDFRDVTFMDSSGIGLIMGRYKLVRTFGGNIAVRNPQVHIKRILTLSGMERIVHIEYKEVKEESYGRFMEERIENIK